jgi:hypothetical protein
MTDVFSWHSPSSRLVINGVLDTLADLGYDGLTIDEVKTRAGAAGQVLGDSLDLEALVIAALEHVELFRPRTPTGDLRRDLRSLLDVWRHALSRDERVIAAVLSAATVRPRLRVAVHEAFDRPLTHAVAAVVARSSGPGDMSPRTIQTLCWVLRGLIVDRLRSGPRSLVDIEILVDFLMAGLNGESAEDRVAEEPHQALEPESAPA